MDGHAASLLDVARWLRDQRGLSVIALDHPDAPLASEPDQVGKRPIAAWKAFQEAYASDDNLTAWFGNGTRRNLGIVTGKLSGVVVVDSDSPAAETWAAEHLPATPMMTKTAKGFHRFYRHPGEPVRNKVRVGGDGLALDVRGDGGYVVGPLSVHHTRAVYERIGPWPPVPELPVFDVRWLLPDESRAVLAPLEAVPDAPEPVPFALPLDQAAMANRARAYLAKIPGAIQGQGGDDATYRVACVLMRDFALEPADAEFLFREWNETCQPPWPIEALRAKLEHARQYGTGAIGAKAAERQAPDTDPATLEADESWYEDGPAFARHAEQIPAAMLVEGLIPGDGLTLLHADPRSFKTWMAVDVALAVATGTPALSALAISAPCSVLYVGNEDSRQRTSDRLLKLARGRGLDSLPPTLLCAVQGGVWLDDSGWQSRLLGLVAERGIRLVVLDPLRSLTGAVDQGPRELQPLAIFLRKLARDAGCAVLAIHHDVKPQAGQPDTRKRAYRASGGGLFSIADAPIHAERLGDEPVVLVHPNNWKHSETPCPLEVRLTISEDRAVLQATPTTATSAVDRELMERVVEYLRMNPDASGNAIAKGVRRRPETLKRVLDSLSASGTVDSRRGPKNANLWFLTGERSPSSAGDVSPGSGQ